MSFSNLQMEKRLAILVFFLNALLTVSGNLLDVSPKQQLVRPGQNVTVLCTTGVGKLLYCRFEVPSLRPRSLRESSNKVGAELGYYGDGLSRGQCGATIFRVKDSYNGEIKCTTAVEDEDREFIGKSILIVGKPPGKPMLDVEPKRDSRWHYDDGERIKVSCQVNGSRPESHIYWTLDNVTITDGIGQEDIHESQTTNLYYSFQTLTRQLSWRDHGRTLYCRARHFMLTEYNNSVSFQIIVHFAPRLKSNPEQTSGTIELFAVLDDPENSIQVEILANPRPTVQWQIEEEILEEGQSNSDSHFKTRPIKDLGNGIWLIGVEAKDITAQDLKKSINLIIKNDKGEASYQVILSNEAPPLAAQFGTLEMIICVASILILLSIILLLMFARIKGKWCFSASQPTLDIPESSDTESADHKTSEKKRLGKKLSGIFNKKNRPDRVAHDTDDTKNFEETKTESSPIQPITSPKSTHDEHKSSVAIPQPNTSVPITLVSPKSSPPPPTQVKDRISPEPELQNLESSESQTHVNTPSPISSPAKNLSDQVVYAELDLQTSPKGVHVRSEEDKTEYAEIMYPIKSEKEKET